MFFLNQHKPYAHRAHRPEPRSRRSVGPRPRLIPGHPPVVLRLEDWLTSSPSERELQLQPRVPCSQRGGPFPLTESLEGVSTSVTIRATTSAAPPRLNLPPQKSPL